MMQTTNGLVLTGQATFGRDAAMFENLLDFVAELSVVLWSLVALTLALRFIGVFMYRRGAARTTSTENWAPNAPVPATAARTGLDGIQRPDGASADVAVSETTPRRAPAFAGSSTGW